MSRTTADQDGLSVAMKTFYRQIVRKYRLEEHHKRLLFVACQAHSRMEQAQDILAADGLTGSDRGAVRPHPCVQVEIQSRVAFMRAVRELGLQSDVPDDARPPRLSGRYQSQR